MAEPRFPVHASTDDLVSVVIPCYNHGRFLGEAIQSVLDQSHEPKEVIVVDDGSIDDTATVAARYGVRYVFQRNQGLSAARNRGIRESRGASLVFLDADDRLLPGALAAGLACLHAHAECAFVYGGYRHIAEDGSIGSAQHSAPAEPDAYLALLRYNHIGMHATVMYRRRVFDLVGDFDTRLRAVEDYELYLRIARRFPIRRHDQMVAEYRKYGASLSDDPVLMLRSILEVLRREEPYVADRHAHLQALREGLQGNRAWYLERLRMLISGPGGRELPWRRKMRLRAALLWYDPPGFLKILALGL